ncbi:serine protease [Phytomonospora sp. NPDC050363]|uniref:trypsin-like serine peptidase n=1 Tax=Phytomonospora sp. NPDC050363 TaxID=3155642 RepID=UPI003408DB64
MRGHKKIWIGAAALLLGGIAFVVGPNAYAGDEETTIAAPARTPAGAATVGVEEAADAVLGYAGESTRTLTYPGASFVKVHFSKLLLAEGDYVTVSNADGSETHRYDNTDGPGTWAMSVEGEQAVLELHRSAGSLLGELPLFGASVDKVTRGLAPEEMTGPRAPESICSRDDKRDAVCYQESDPAAFNRSAAVARLLIDGTTLCTAWRVGAKNRLMTNHHCFESTGQAQATEVWFGYECTSCGGEYAHDPVKVRGEEVLATDQVYDYTLFTVDDFPAIEDFGYLEFDNRVTTRGEKLYIPQHPSGKPLQIAVDSDADEGGHCRVEAPKYQGYEAETDVGYKCDTEFGSSGSPVIARSTGKVVALHHFGGCPNSGVRADLLWTELKRLL